MITSLKCKLCLTNLSLTSGHPSYAASFVIPQGWPHKRGTTVVGLQTFYVHTNVLSHFLVKKEILDLAILW